MHPWKRYCPNLASLLNTFAIPSDAYTIAKWERELGTGNWGHGSGGQGTGGSKLGAGNLGQGTGVSKLDRELGAGNWDRELGQGTRGSKLETGNLGQETVDRELGAGIWGGTGGQQTGPPSQNGRKVLSFRRLAKASGNRGRCHHPALPSGLYCNQY